MYLYLYRAPNSSKVYQIILKRASKRKANQLLKQVVGPDAIKDLTEHKMINLKKKSNEHHSIWTLEILAAKSN